MPTPMVNCVNIKLRMQMNSTASDKTVIDIELCIWMYLPISKDRHGWLLIKLAVTNISQGEAEYRRNRQQIRPAHLPTRELSQEQSSYDEEIRTSNEFKNDLEPTTDMCSRVQSENSETNPKSITTRSGRVVKSPARME
ncbi:hypothetical protein Trydic_g12170 [Trypoxylus dichotomus]